MGRKVGKTGIMIALLLMSMTLMVNLITVKASGTICIMADGSIDPPTAPIQRDGDTYTFTDNIYDSIAIERSNIVVNGAGYTVQGTGTGTGITLSGRINVTIQNMTIKTLYYGIYLYSSSKNSIAGNNITANNYGIWLESSSNNSIIGNNITNSSLGILFTMTSENNTVSRNGVKDNVNGIFFGDSSYYNEIIENDIKSNNQSGIYVGGYSAYNFITQNSLTNNIYGIKFDYSSSDNTIYHNNFIDNTYQADTNLANLWDDGYPSGGNYWSDYTGVDADIDGIGDTPYIINMNNIDHYPLIHAWNSTFLEQQVVDFVNGSRAYDWDLELENIALGHFGFRVGGSIGANETANWIKRQFENFGLEAWLEPFEFTTWDLLNKSSLLIDEDGNQSTTSDQTIIPTFQCEHHSWPTPETGAFADLVILPLPEAADYSEIGLNPIDMTEWNAIDITDKILLIGREVCFDTNWHQTYVTKLTEQPPAAVVYTWWYDWMSFTPDLFTGGWPISGKGAYYWHLQIPVGFVSYEDGWLIRVLEPMWNISAHVLIRAVIDTGIHYNVVGRIRGSQNPEKLVIISSHYDTAMCSGFCDNGAGTSGVIELAKVFAEVVAKGIYKPRYTLLFIAFADEEIGLVGSINYVKQHKNEMLNITAVINLDCIGSDEFYITETNPVNGFDLDEIVLNAAQDLGITGTIYPRPSGSDTDPFCKPRLASGLYYRIWGLDAGISDVTPVESSAMLISYPVLYHDKWSMGTPGWIHTSYDNSTSTGTLNWVEAEDLGNHIKIAALTILRVSPDTRLLIDWWLMFRHDLSHSGYSTSTAPQTNNTIWNYATGGSIWSSPAIVDNKVYVGSNDGKIYCLNALTGAHIWSYTTNDIVDSSPAVAYGYVYIGSTDNNVYCLDASTGAKIWNYTTGGDVRSSPTIDSGNLYVGSYDNEMYCLNAFSGALIWSYTTGGPISSSPAVADGRVFVGSFDDKVYCLNASTGEYIWSYTTGGNVYSSPTVADGLVYVGSADKTLYCLLASSGAIDWYFTTGGDVRSPAVAYNRVYFGSLDGKIYCLSTFTGVPLWSYTTEGEVRSSPAIADGKVYFGSFDNKVYCLNATDLTYIWSYKTESFVISSPAIADGKVYVESDDCNVYCCGHINDIAIKNVIPSKTVVGSGYTMSINVTIENQGDYTETSNVKVYANATSIASKTITLESSKFITITFIWNTTGFERGNYIINAYATPVPGEAEIEDNTSPDIEVLVAVPCDISGTTPGVPDGVCNMRDIGYMCAHFMTTPSSPNWDPNCDVTGPTPREPDNVVNMRDIGEACNNFLNQNP